MDILFLIILPACTFQPYLDKESQLAIGAWGPVPVEMECEGSNLEDNLSIFSKPKAEFAVHQTGENTFQLIPQSPLSAGEDYQISINCGQGWQEILISIREPCILYISDPFGLSEIWKKCSGEEPVRITDTQGQIAEFRVSGDGNSIVYSLKDSGIFYRTGNNGENPRLVLSCPTGVCSELTHNPFVGMYAYSQIGNPSRLVILNNDFEEIYVQESLIADLQFSPDGRFLNYFNEDMGVVEIINLENFQKQQYASDIGLIGSWSADSENLLVGENEFNGGLPETRLFEVNPHEGSETTLFDTGEKQIEIYSPIYTGTPDWLVAAVRERRAGFSRQIWRIRKDGSAFEALTDDYRYSHSFANWNSDFSMLLFQRIRIDISEGVPEIFFWDEMKDKIELVAQNASRPCWLP